MTTSNGSFEAGRPVGRGNPAQQVPLLSPEFFWMDDAACKGRSLDLFFPNDEEKGEVLTERRAAGAYFICDSCPVQVECLEYALTKPENHGVWGGLTPAHRSRRGFRVLEMLKRKRDGRL